MLFLIILIAAPIALFLFGTIGPYIALLIILLAFAYRIEILHENISTIKKHLELTNGKFDDK
ncbi:hypothetical protein [Clostridium sp.]|uniref:hypothetical protein n=1 Tax=Clostridium sp. TaxID=1506 RepID=UPI002FC8BEAF